MLTFVTKDQLWRCLEEGVFAAIGVNDPSSLSAVQAAVIYDRVSELEFSKILEINKGAPLLADALSIKNEVDVALYGNQGAGLHKSVKRPGELTELFEKDRYDVVISTNVMTGLNGEDIPLLAEQVIELLRPGGMALHSLEFSIEDQPSPHWQECFTNLRALTHQPGVAPLGPVIEELAFSCGMATVPDMAVHSRKNAAPRMDALRRRCQIVAMLVAVRKL